MMEEWNNGNKLKLFFAYIIPTFQYSIIPAGQRHGV
jgi:hypothetical protein